MVASVCIGTVVKGFPRYIGVSWFTSGTLPDGVTGVGYWFGGG